MLRASRRTPRIHSSGPHHLATANSTPDALHFPDDDVRSSLLPVRSSARKAKIGHEAGLVFSRRRCWLETVCLPACSLLGELGMDCWRCVWCAVGVYGAVCLSVSALLLAFTECVCGALLCHTCACKCPEVLSWSTAVLLTLLSSFVNFWIEKCLDRPSCISTTTTMRMTLMSVSYFPLFHSARGGVGIGIGVGVYLLMGIEVQELGFLLVPWACLIGRSVFWDTYVALVRLFGFIAQQFPCF